VFPKEIVELAELLPERLLLVTRYAAVRLGKSPETPVAEL
jgi:hypothetical protein